MHNQQVMMERYVTVYQTTDPVEAEMLEELLRDSGLDVRLLGTRNAALLGAGQHIMALRLEVPGSQSEQAAELLAAFTAKPAPADEQADESQARADQEDDWDQYRQRLSHILAGGAIVVVLGGSHLYARRPYTSAFIAIGQLCAFTGMLFGSYLESNAATVLFFGLLVYDLAFGQLAIRAWNRGDRASPRQQALVGLVALAFLATMAVLVAPHIPPSRPQHPERRMFSTAKPHLLPSLWGGASTTQRPSLGAACVGSGRPMN